MALQLFQAQSLSFPAGQTHLTPSHLKDLHTEVVVQGGSNAFFANTDRGEREVLLDLVRFNSTLTPIAR